MKDDIKLMTLRTQNMITAGVVMLGAAAASAQDKLDFKLDGVDTAANAALTIGAGITGLFALYRVGKRAANRI